MLRAPHLSGGASIVSASAASPRVSPRAFGPFRLFRLVLPAISLTCLSTSANGAAISAAGGRSDTG